MDKCLFRLLALAGTVVAFCLSSCGEKDGEENPSSEGSSSCAPSEEFYSSEESVHEHTYNSSWEHDSDYHWHPSTCGHYVKGDKAKHNFTSSVTEATYSSGGYTTYTCSVCGYSYKDGETEKLEHSYSNEWSHDSSSHWHACVDEGYSYLKKDEAGHDFDETVVKATHSSGGYTAYTCSVCGCSYKDNETSPLPITITWLNYDGSLLKTSSVSYGETPSYDGEVPTKEGDAQYSYVFQGWYPALSPVTEETTYTAKFTSQTNLYAITWKDYDGTVLDVDNLPYGAVPAYDGSDPVRANDNEYSYRFTGWSPEIVPVVREAAYVAQYEAVRSYFTIAYSPNGGSGGPASQLKEKGVDLTIPSEIPERSGYTFMGWNCLLSEDVFQAGDPVTFDEDMTFFAMWCEHCSNCDGKGKIEQSNTCSSCNGKGKTSKSEDVWVSCSSCSGKGYSMTTSVCSSCKGFGGDVLCECSCGYTWWANKSGSRKCAKCGKTVSGTRYTTCSSCSGNGTVTSKQNCSSCSGKGGKYVTYSSSSTCSSCGGSGKIVKEVTCSSCSGNPLIYPEAPTLVSYDNDSITVEEKVGYEYSLDGKNWQKSGTFEGLNDESSYSVFQRTASTSTKPFGVTSSPLSVTTALACSITYELNGGSQAGNPTKLHNGHGEITLDEPEKKGYEFLGWTGSNGNEPQKEIAIASDAVGTFTYSANWGIVEYSIIYDLDGGVLEEENPSFYTIEDSFQLNSPSKAGYAFEGWYEGSAKVSSISKGTTGNLSLAARWAAVSYNITYNLSGGTNSSGNPGSYTIESPAISLSDPTREGYTFEGWYSDSSFETEKSSIPAGSTGNVAFYAKWAAAKHNLSVSSGDSSKGTASITSGSGYTDESVTVSASPIGDYVFKGWYSGEGLVSKANPYTFPMPAQNYSLTALFWTKAEDEEERRRGLGMTPVFSEDGKSLTYGLYPQTHVSEETEKSTVDSLNALTAAEAEGNGWYLLNGEYYAKATAKPCGSSYKFDDGTTIVRGTTYWFRCEPIKWDILKTEEGSYFLLSDRLLDAHRYNEYYEGEKNGYYANSYENSEIREWLNGAFYDSAFALDSSLVMETEVDNSASTTYSSPNSYACGKTTDKVFLPSYQDYKNADYGFSTSSSDYDAARRCKTTDWARANYAWCSISSSYLYNGYYWTRSPNPSNSYRASRVDGGGYLASGISVNNSYSAVRPCLKLRRTA